MELVTLDFVSVMSATGAKTARTLRVQVQVATTTKLVTNKFASMHARRDIITPVFTLLFLLLNDGLYNT